MYDVASFIVTVLELKDAILFLSFILNADVLLFPESAASPGVPHVRILPVLTFLSRCLLSAVKSSPENH